MDLQAGALGETGAGRPADERHLEQAAAAAPGEVYVVFSSSLGSSDTSVL